jgi:NAD(P) transhydrogenase
MNRSIWNVLFGSIVAPTASAGKAEQEVLPVVQTNVDEVAEALANAETVIITPGYGLAVAKAQYAVAETVKMLTDNGVKVRFGKFFDSWC